MRLIALLLFLASHAMATDVVRVDTFPDAKALPFYAAAGTFDIAHSAVDNAVAMVEDAKQDVVIVTGGDNGMNEFYTQPHIRKLADLRGQTLVVDAPNTAYALLAKKILQGRPAGGARLHGQACRAGRAAAQGDDRQPRQFRSFGNPVEILGPYQAGGAFMLR